MKIWLDTAPHSSARWKSEGGIHRDCECDCGDCDLHDKTFPAYETFSARRDGQKIHYGDLAGKMLKLNPALHLQECDEGRWLACNPIGTGTVTVLDAPALSLLERFRSPTLLSSLLAQRQHLSARHIEEATALFYDTGLINDSAQPPRAFQETPPRTLQAWLHVTNACNLNCHYCYVSKSKEQMSEDVSQRAVQAIFRSARKQNFAGVRVKYAGGEASLSWHNILALHRYATRLAGESGMEFSAYMISNGVMLPQRLIEQFKEHQIGITISLDGIDEYHDSQRSFASGLGSFKYVDRTINKLLASDFTPHINVTVSRRNLAGLPALIEYILVRDLPFTLSYYRENACSMHLHDLQYADEQMIGAMRAAFGVIEDHLPQRRLLGGLIDKADMRASHSHPCSAGRNYLVIDQHGGISKCHTEMQRPVSSIDADDPLAAIQSDRSDFVNLPVDQKEGCRTCTWRYWCTGGCPLVTYRTTGRNNIRSPNCQIYQALFPDALRLEALRLLKYEIPVIL